MKNYFYNAEKSFYCFFGETFSLKWLKISDPLFLLYIYILDPEMETHLPTVVRLLCGQGALTLMRKEL